MLIYPAALLRLLAPTVLIGASFWLRDFTDSLGTDTRVVLNYLPYLLCAVALFLAYQFNRCRLMLATIALVVLRNEETEATLLGVLAALFLILGLFYAHGFIPNQPCRWGRHGVSLRR
tara:strand:- start:141249 stop:141602 length:354 start_codon:yes stop_codon:yes gene_type:complete